MRNVSFATLARVGKGRGAVDWVDGSVCERDGMGESGAARGKRIKLVAEADVVRSAERMEVDLATGGGLVDRGGRGNNSKLS